MDFEDFYSLATQEGSSRALRTIAGLEKGRLQREKQEYEYLAKEKKAAEDNLKWTMGQLIGSYHQSKSTAEKNMLRESMLQLYSVADPFLRPAIEPLIRHSPISPEEEKARLFEEMNPAPPRPGQRISVAPSFGKGAFKETDEPVMELTQELGAPREYAEEYFRYSDWTRQRNQVVFGHGGEKENFVEIPGIGAAIRTNEGRISIYSERDLGLKDIAEKLGKTVGDVLAGQGYLYSDEFKAIEGDKLITYKIGTSVIPGLPEKKLVQTNVAMAPKGSPESYPQGLTDFLIGFTGNDIKKHPEVARFNELFEGYSSSKKGEEKQAYAGTIKAQLGNLFPGYSFRFEEHDKEKAKKATVLGIPIPFTGGSSKFRLIPIRGVPRNFGTPQTPKILWQDENDFLYDANNIRLGTLSELPAILGGK